MATYAHRQLEVDALVQLALNLRQRYPGLRIVGGYSPPHRPLTEDERRSTIDEINAANPDVVWVGIGVPKQEKWMLDVRNEVRAPVLVGVGAAFDFHAGLVPQAPPFMQGVEHFTFHVGSGTEVLLDVPLDQENGARPAASARDDRSGRPVSPR